MNQHHSNYAPNEPVRRILVVENDQELIDVYTTRLEVEGFKVQSLKQGDKVYQKALDFKPDMILLDIRLGNSDGLDVLQELRNHPETKNVKAIIITVLFVDEIEKRARKLGALEYLVKSTTVLADIVEHIKEHLGMVSPLEEMIEEAPASVR